MPDEFLRQLHSVWILSGNAHSTLLTELPIKIREHFRLLCSYVYPLISRMLFAQNEISTGELASKEHKQHTLTGNDLAGLASNVSRLGNSQAALFLYLANQR